MVYKIRKLSIKYIHISLRMGKDKSKKHKKDKKKKSKNRKAKYSSSYGEEWVEKNVGCSSSEEKRKYKKRKKDYNSSSEDEWVEKKTRVSSPSSEEEWAEKRINTNNSSSEEDRINNKLYPANRKYRSDNTSSSEDEDRSKSTRKSSKEKAYTGDISDSTSEDEWVEKKGKNRSSSEDDYINKGSYSHERKFSSEGENKSKIKSKSSVDSAEDKRGGWMNLPTTFLTSSNSDRKREREEAKRLEREKQQYDPRNCPRELNPYWKDGGDGLPTFKKPKLDDEYQNLSNKSKTQNRSSNWRKKKDIEVLSDPNVKQSTQEPEKSESKDDKILTEKELNLLAAKLVKAEIMGNTKLVNELKVELEKARILQRDSKLSQKPEDGVLLTHTDSQGRSQPLKLQSEYGESSGFHKRKKNIETHKDGQRVRYFADDDKYSLKQMFEKEKYNSVEDQNSEFIKMAGKIRKNDDLDDVFADNIRKKASDSKIDSKNRDRAIHEHERVNKSLDNCSRCIQSEQMPKHLMISMGATTYLALPSFEPLTEGHCLITPIRHTPCSTQLDENEWTDILDMRKALVRLFTSRNEDVIFFETAISLHKFPHMYIECVPMPKEEGDMAPIYFKKAIDESETEWAHNKKLVSLKGRDVRKAIPKGLPYFSVSFGMDEGFAHVIEDEQLFPKNFAQEIIGGMLDIDHSKWRKPKKQNFEEQSKRVLAFSNDWKEFDAT